ncbi:MAG: hypothetical protein HGGPFJEG_01910 [Ignavibacteria bacterium]|nr:hypothetical protein [Ignavibacteria bacterium]
MAESDQQSSKKGESAVVKIKIPEFLFEYSNTHLIPVKENELILLQLLFPPDKLIKIIDHPPRI